MHQAQVDARMAVNGSLDASFREQLLIRRDRLQAAVPAARNGTPHLQRLLRDVDQALDRMETGTFGLCETCHDPIEKDRLLADPLCRNCLDHLSASEKRTLERDLDLAYQVQRGLLPQATVTINGWAVAHVYEPAGPVSGDYCDLIALEGGNGLFAIGDVTGKGVAASILMAQLHAIFRSLAPSNLSVAELVGQANRVFCRGTVLSHFATLVCGHLGGDGEVEICNAGHCLPLHIRRSGVSRPDSTGLPLGLLGDAEYQSQRLTLDEGECLVLYSDGVSESFDDAGEQYGSQRLARLAEMHRDADARAIVNAIVQDVKQYRSLARQADDLTLMVIRRERSFGNAP